MRYLHLRFLFVLFSVLSHLPLSAESCMGTYYLRTGETMRIENSGGRYNYNSDRGFDWRWELEIVGSGFYGVSITNSNLAYCDIMANASLKKNDMKVCFTYDYYYLSTNSYQTFKLTNVCYYLIKYKETKVTKINLNSNSESLGIGKTFQLTATVTPSDADDKTVTWSSNQTSVATVSSSGLVEAKSPGTAKITCKANDGSGVSATCTVTVHGPPVAEINATNFPDANFRNYLLSQSYGEDGELTEDEIKSIISIKVVEKEIASLKGIEFFTALRTLYCENNQLTSLDVSKNTALNDLQCQNNQLTSLDVSKNTALISLDCYNNQLTTLDVTKNTALTSLSCYTNRLTSLDVSKNTALTKLHCHNNQLTSLDVSKNTALKTLYCHNNQLTSLDVSKNTALTTLYCYNNQLTSLDVSKNTALISLDCYNNQLTTHDVTKNTALTSLSCYTNQLTSLDVSKNTALISLDCYNNQLTTLDVTKNTALKRLVCYANQLTSLDVSKNTALTYLWCQSNQLSQLDVSKNTALEDLSCENNPLSSLDVSKNTALKRLFSSNIQLASLDVSKNTALTYLRCTHNVLTQLDVSKNTALKELECHNNQLTSLDVSKNTVLTNLWCYTNQLTSLDVSKNTALTSLVCGTNQLTSLDVSKNTALTTLLCGTNQLTSLDVSKNTALTSLSCYTNQLTSLDVSKNTALTFLYCFDNDIKGEAMDKLISSLPQNKTSDIHRFIVVGEDLVKEGNVCTVSQVEAAKAKGWTPCYYDSTTKEYVDFEGSSAVVLIDNIILSSNTLTLDEGKTQLLTATVTPSNATDKSVTWSSSNTSVATVSSSGLVTAKSAGTAIITCKANDGSGKEATCKVTVQSVPTTPEIYITSIKSGNTNLMSLTKEDNLSLTAIFKNYGATTTAYARLWIFDQNMETVAYSDYQSYPFNADSETTVSMDYALTDIPAGKYFASILYYDEWERNTWLYSSEYLVDIEIVDPSPINKGDVNEDGKVNGTDLVALTNIILGKNAQKASADVNGDGKVNGTDYVALANIILGKSAASRSLDTDMAVSGTATLHVEPVAIKAGETRELTVNLTNPDDELTLLQFELLLPDGLYINKVDDNPSVSMGSRTSVNSHQLSAYADGQRVRCLLASPGNELISGTEGAVVRLTVTAADNFCGGSLLLANAIGVSPCEQEVMMPSQRYGLTESATGVTDVKNAEESSEVYSLTGQRQVKMKRGINVVNGKKIIKK